MPRLCVDANLVVSRLLPSQHTPPIDEFWLRAFEARTKVIAPPLLFAEVASALRLRIYRGDLDRKEGDVLLDKLLELGIVESNPPALKRRAWELANLCGHPRAYDAQYLALAEIEGCELHTADVRLYRSAHDKAPWVKLVGATP